MKVFSPCLDISRQNDNASIASALEYLFTHLCYQIRFGDIDGSKIVGGTLRIEEEYWDKQFVLELEIVEDA